MTPAQRIAAIRESATLLSQQPWNDINLILKQHGRQTVYDWVGDDRYEYVVSMIEAASNEGLHDLHQYLIGDTGDVPVAAQPWGQGKLKLFMSHLAVQQEFVGYVRGNLNWYGVSSFVAHVSIEPSKEWQDVIEVALRSCDAMAVFLHKGFHESSWCDQEVGFAMARRVPILPIAIDVMPYGFMGKLQALRCQPNDRPPQVGDKVLNWLVKSPSTQTAMTEGLVTAFERSGSYDRTRQVYRMLAGMPTFMPIQLQRLETATKANSEVRDAVLGSNTIPDLIRELIVKHGDTPASIPSGYSDEPPF